MDLSQFDDKHVRITLTDGSVYEGICSYNSEEYNECEWGKDEDGLQLPAMLIGRSEIASVESLEEREDGPWGKFSEPFGRLEEESLFFEDGDPVLACEILALSDPALRDRLHARKKALHDKVVAADAKLRDSL